MPCLVEAQTSPTGAAASPTASGGSTTTLSPENQGLLDSTTTQVETKSNDASSQFFIETHQMAGTTNFTNEMQTLNQSIASAGSAAQLQQIVSQLMQFQGACDNFKNRSVECCSQPESCSGGGGSFGEILKAGASLGAMVMSATAQEGSAMQCLAGLPSLLNGLFAGETNRKGCAKMRSGENGMEGCSSLCSKVARAAGSVSQSAAKFLSNPAEASIASNVISQANGIAKETQTLAGECNKSLAQGEQKSGQQTESMGQGLQQMIQCKNDLENGDLKDPEALPEAQPDCSVAAHLYPDKCGGAAGLNPNGGSFKASAPGFDLGGTDFNEKDLPVGGGNSNKAAEGGEGASPVAAGSGGGGGGFFGGSRGSGNAGASRKAGGQRRLAGDSLISGFKGGSGGGGGGGYKGRSKKGKGSRLGLFKPKKLSDKDKIKNAAAALAKLSKMGISMDQSGSIFERITKRFVTASTEKKLYDCKRNQKHWMNK